MSSIRREILWKAIIKMGGWSALHLLFSSRWFVFYLSRFLCHVNVETIWNFSFKLWINCTFLTRMKLEFQSIYNKEKKHPFRKCSMLIRIYKVIPFLHGLHHFELLTAMSLISAYFCAFNCTVVWFIFPSCMIFFKRINNNLNEGRDNCK